VYTWSDYSKIDFSTLTNEEIYNIDEGVNEIYSSSTLNIIFSSMTSPPKYFDYDVHTLENIKVYEVIIPNYNEQLYESKRIWGIY
jgi:protease II